MLENQTSKTDLEETLIIKVSWHLRNHLLAHKRK